MTWSLYQGACHTLYPFMPAKCELSTHAASLLQIVCGALKGKSNNFCRACTDETPDKLVLKLTDTATLCVTHLTSNRAEHATIDTAVAIGGEGSGTHAVLTCDLQMLL